MYPDKAPKDSRIKGRYIVQVVENHSVYEVERAVRHAGFKTLRPTLEMPDRFVIYVSGDSQEDLKKIEAITGVIEVRQDHWNVGFGF